MANCFSIGHRPAVKIEEEGAAEALALAFWHISLLEYEFKHMEESLLVLKNHEQLDEESLLEWPTNDSHDLPGLIQQLDQLEYSVVPARPEAKKPAEPSPNRPGQNDGLGRLLAGF